jgi:hypothetical protein
MQFPSYLLNSNVNNIILFVKYMKQKNAILLHTEIVFLGDIIHHLWRNLTFNVINVTFDIWEAFVSYYTDCECVWLKDCLEENVCFSS